MQSTTPSLDVIGLAGDSCQRALFKSLIESSSLGSAQCITYSDDESCPEQSWVISSGTVLVRLRLVNEIPQDTYCLFLGNALKCPDAQELTSRRRQRDAARCYIQRWIDQHEFI
jgi:hypothetical protein